MPIIANTTSSNTFSAVRAQLNSVTKRINQFAINESALYANTITANVTLNIVGGLKANNSLGTSGYTLKTNGTSIYWDAAASGAVGGGSDKVFWENDATVTTNYTITANKNAGSFGPITINTGVTVTIPSTSTWTIV